MSNLIPFQFDSHEVRTVTGNGEAWVVAKDVAEALGYAWNGAARIAHVPAEWRGVTSVVTPSGAQDMAILSEQGLYFFLARSDKPKALPFQKWIAGEVLPQIRRTGSYGKPKSFSPVAKEFVAHYRIAKLFYQGNQALLAANKATRQSTGVDAAQTLGATHLFAETQEQLLTPTDIGARLDGRSAVATNKLLADLGFQLEQRDLRGRKHWELTETGKQHAVYMDTGKKRSDGTPVRQIKWLASVLNLIQPKAA